MTDCPVAGCAGEPHTCDAIDRHAFDVPEESGVRLNAWLAPMEFGPSSIWIFTSMTEMTIANHQKQEVAQ